MPISFRNLGHMGYLGNQMFQYAALRGIAAKNNLQWIVPAPDTETPYNYNLYNAFEMSSSTTDNFTELNTERILDVQSFNFIDKLYNSCPDNSDLVGYFQTERYFEEISDEIRKDFTFKKDIIKTVDDFFSTIDDKKNCIFLHVRRGDYKNHPDHHPLLTIEYYKKALDLFDDKLKVIILSDDIEWCKEQEFFNQDRFYFSDFSLEKDKRSVYENVRFSLPYIDLCIMSSCSGGIVANSSLSWWGAWLINNPVNSIIVPDPWFGPAYNHFDTSDLIPKRWRKLNINE
jgi:hypothetical protein